MEEKQGFFSRLFRRSSSNRDPEPREDKVIPPGRVSVPDDGLNLNGLTKELNILGPSFREDLIPLIRDLYKVNPDVSIALQDMMKLANTGHSIEFPYNTDAEASKMKEHLRNTSKNWSQYTAGIDGLVNKFIVQILVSGAISIEAVPNKNLNGLATIVFVKPEKIRFKRSKEGKYEPYQINPYNTESLDKPQYIKLNPNTYLYVGMYNDTDEPYGVPPFMPALDSIKQQHDMRVNFKHIMELMGMVGFVEALMEKPSRQANESPQAYKSRLSSTLTQMKKSIIGSLRDGVVVGFKDDHEFKLNSTTKDMGHLDGVWNMNQQSVANGLGVTGNLIGVNTNTTEGGAGINLSKMISQLRNIQIFVAYTLEFIYGLELQLAGFPNKGVKVTFNTSTISDELKVQQGLEYKLRNLTTLYNQGIISQDQYAKAMGYAKADQEEPRAPVEGVSDDGQDAQKKKREADKDTSDRKTRDKAKTNPKRHDQDSRPR